MKRAAVRATRRLADGRRLVNVICPFCNRRHWLPNGPTGECPRRTGEFAINQATRERETP